MNSSALLKRIATKSLRACYAQNGVVASPTHFSDFWARDTFFAVPGMMVAGDYDKVKESLLLFLRYQRADGKIPRKLSRDINSLKYLFHKRVVRKKLRPTYHGLIKPFYALDSELLFVIACARYLDETRDYDFAEAHYRAIQQALQWHISRAKNGFIHENFLGNWMDTVFKHGPVLYTNVLYVRAMEAMVLICQVAGYDDDAEVYIHRARSLKRRLQKEFWHGSFFVDELHHVSDVFDVAGNVLALYYDVANPAQQKKLVSYILALYDTYGTWIPAVPTGHKWYKINPLVRVFGMGGYHTTTTWLWIIAYLAQILHRAGYESVAQEIYHDIATVAQRDGEIGETYFSDGTPYQTRFWHSASPFLWSSGVVLETLERCGSITRDHTYEKPEPRIC